MAMARRSQWAWSHGPAGEGLSLASIRLAGPGALPPSPSGQQLQLSGPRNCSSWPLDDARYAVRLPTGSAASRSGADCDGGRETA